MVKQEVEESSQIPIVAEKRKVGRPPKSKFKAFCGVKSELDPCGFSVNPEQSHLIFDQGLRESEFEQTIN